MSTKSLAPLALAALLSLSGAAQAAITVYTTKASYLAAISAPGVDTFNDLNPTATLSTPQFRNAGAYGYTVAVGPTSIFFPAGTLNGDVWLSTNNRLDTVTFDSFAAGVRGVGGFFFGSTAAGTFASAPSIGVSATDASGTTTQTLLTPATTTFLGFVSTGPMTNVKVFVPVLGTGVAGVWPTINDLTLGVAGPIPEPQTYALMLGGLALVGAIARRRKG